MSANTVNPPVPKGYKWTEVGVIPTDWDAIQIGEFFTFKNGLNKAKQYFGQGIPIVNYMDVFSSSGLHAQGILGRVTLSKEEIERFNVRAGDVFFTRTSETVDEIGISSVLLEDLENGVFSGFVLRGRPIDNRLRNAFKKYCFSHSAVRSQIVSTATYTTRALTNGRLLSKVRIALPSTTDEQDAIAEALSDVDGLIGALEKLIAKKRAIKQAAMQQLLTGKTRLPGFSGEWEMRRLGEIATVSKGTQLRSSVTLEQGQFPHLNGGISPSGYADVFNTPGYTIAISEGGNSCGYVQFMTGPYWCGGHCYSVLPRGVDNHFFYHALKVRQASIMALRVGSGLPNVQKPALLGFELEYPTSETEQVAIATILSDMDAEIAALEQRRDKTKQIKQGMMQQLLTGRIRLIKTMEME